MRTQEQANGVGPHCWPRKPEFGGANRCFHARAKRAKRDFEGYIPCLET